MTTLTDLLERKQRLEQENARIQRDLGILRRIDELASQLDEPRIPDPPPYEGDGKPAAAVEAPPAPPEPAPAAPPAPPPPPRPAPPGTDEPEAKAKKVSREAVAKLHQALVDAGGTALQIDLQRATGLASPTVTQACRQLKADGAIHAIGKGGYMNKSIKWQLTAADLPPKSPLPVSPRVRRVIEQDAKRAARRGKDRQPPTHEGRILSLLLFHQTMTVPELAAELGIPASTVGRLVAKLKDENEVYDSDGRGNWRRRMG